MNIKLKSLVTEWTWKDPEFQGAKLLYRGPGFTAGGDYFFTAKNKKLWKFVFGVNDTKNPPYVKYIKTVNSIKFPTGDNDVDYIGKTYGPLGTIKLYKLKSGKIIWEY